LNRSREVPVQKSFVTLSLLTLVCMPSFHCGVTQPVRVLDKGDSQISASLGGPFIPTRSATIPVPYLNIGIIHGYSENLTLTGNIHVLPLLFGDAGLDAGAAARVVRQDGLLPELTVKGQLTFFFGVREGIQTRAYPQASLNASYLMGQSDLLYLGVDNWFQSASPSYLFTPLLGYQFPLGDRWRGQLETKWMAANVNTSRGIFEGHSNIAHFGNTSVFIALLYSF
jgi:hypothetical protein